MQWISKNPYKAGTFAIIVTSPVMDYWLKRKANHDLVESVLKKIEAGTKPSLPVGYLTNMVRRPKLDKELYKLFYPTSPTKDKFFGIVMGPSGTGKTFAIRNLCRSYPSGAIYYEVREHSFFAENLSKEVDLKIKPSNVFDLAIACLSDKYVRYVHLPESSVESTAIILQMIEEACKKYLQTHGVVPVLFIDGADLVAKQNPLLFSSLITQAKIMANRNILSIVFISSEGSVMPLLKNASGMNRSTKIVEVDDIPDEDAYNYLVK